MRAVHYRGEGWPGDFRVSGGNGELRMSYGESWGKLTSYRPLRCHLCPDGTGQVADIVCGDAWHHYREGGCDPGRSLVLARSATGTSVLMAAAAAGMLELVQSRREEVRAAQPSLLGRRVDLYGRLVGLRLIGTPVPRFCGFDLLRVWKSANVSRRFRSIAGTWRRGLLRRWWARAVSHSDTKSG
ncbi:MAG: hypothetical protein Kow001_15690 [Acidobacteriota bacterium]